MPIKHNIYYLFMQAFLQILLIEVFENYCLFGYLKNLILC